MNARAGFVVVLLCALPPVSAGAEPFTILPDGNVVFNVAYTTTGVFQCHTAMCTGSGTSSVTLGAGDNATTLTFTGVSATAAVGNTLTAVPIGSFESTPVGPDFTFPAGMNPNVPILAFTLTATQSSPVPDSVPSHWTFGPGGGSDLPLLSAALDHFALSLGVNPPGFNYPRAVYTFSPFPFSILGSGVTVLEAQAGAIPEPATMLLVGSGLAGAAALRRRRARRARVVH
jgi:hypothetical protein